MLYIKHTSSHTCYKDGVVSLNVDDSKFLIRKELITFLDINGVLCNAHNLLREEIRYYYFCVESRTNRSVIEGGANPDIVLRVTIVVVEENV